MINNKTINEHLLNNFISKGKENSLTLQNTNLFTIANGLKLPTSNILRNKYRGILLENSVEINLDEDTLKLYKYRPKTLSLKLYGTTDLWHLIIWLNNMTSVTQFNKSRLILFNPNSMDVLIKIIDQEKELIYSNKQNPDVYLNESKTIRR